MSILIAGGYGFVGSHIAEQLARSGEGVIIYDLRQTDRDYMRPVADQIAFIQGDILDFHALTAAFKSGGDIDGAIYAVMPPATQAGTVQSRGSLNHPCMIAVNGLLNLLEAARLFDVRNVVYLSSGAVYGDQAGRWFEDETPIRPVDLYGALKASGELIGLQYAAQNGMDFKAIRLMHVYGPGVIPHRNRRLYPLYGALEGHRVIRTERGWDGKQDVTFVKDAAKGAILAYRAQTPSLKVFNISGGRVYTTPEIIEVIKRHAPNLETIDIGPGVVTPRYAVGGPLDLSRSKSILGYEPDHDLEAGVTDYANWISANLEMGKRESNESLWRGV